MKKDQQKPHSTLVRFLLLVRMILRLCFLLASFYLFLLYILKETDKGTCPYNKSACNFASTYLHARALFKQNAEKANAIIIEQSLENHTNSFDLELTIAILGLKNHQKSFYKSIDSIDFLIENKTCMIYQSGVHGVEGYIGSSIQNAFLEKIINKQIQLQEDQCVILIHSINPHGFLYSRRYNENNVDLNRNLLESAEKFSQKHSDNKQDYESLQNLINPSQEWDPIYSELNFLYQAAIEFTTRGFQAIKAILVKAQYFNEKGLMHGGKEYQQSVLHILNLIQNKLKLNHIPCIIIDGHSGLGQEGKDTLMIEGPKEKNITYQIFVNNNKNNNNNNEDDDDYDYDYNKILGLDFFIDTDKDSTSDVSQGYEDVEGTFDNLLYLTKFKQGLFVTQEFGTVSGFEVIRASVMENSNWFYGSQKSKSLSAQSLKNVFYVQNAAFKNNVISRGLIVIQQALKALEDPQIVAKLPNYD